MGQTHPTKGIPVTDYIPSPSILPTVPLLSISTRTDLLLERFRILRTIFGDTEG